MNLRGALGWLARSTAAAGDSGLHALRHSGGTVVVTYHSVAPQGTGGYEYRTTPEAFEAQIDWLGRLGRFVTVDEAAGALLSEPARYGGVQVAVTFDDGYRDFERFAHPLLVERRVPFTLYVATAYADQAGASFLGWKELRSIRDSGCARIGSHSCIHSHLAALDPADAMREIEASRRRIEAELGEAPDSLSYPFGGATVELAAAAKAAGFTSAFLDRAVPPPFEPFLLPRVCLDGATVVNGDLATRLIRAMVTTGQWFRRKRTW